MTDGLVACPDCGRLVRGVAPVGTTATAATQGAEVIWLPVDLQSIAAARAHAAAVLAGRGVDPADLDDAVVLVSELATEALSTGTEFFGVVVDVVDGRVTVNVRTLTGPGHDDAPVAETTTPQWHGHRQKVIAALADEWGVARARRSTNAWFALVLSLPHSRDKA